MALKEVCLTPFRPVRMILPKEATGGVVWHLRLKLKLLGLDRLGRQMHSHFNVLALWSTFCLFG